MENIVYRTHARTTGTEVEVIDNRDRSFDSDDPNGWFNVCRTHGYVVSHETRARAEEFAAHPEEWCEVCMGNEPE